MIKTVKPNKGTEGTHLVDTIYRIRKIEQMMIPDMTERTVRIERHRVTP